MFNLSCCDPIAKSPASELNDSLATFLNPVCAMLPDRRLHEVAVLIVRGVATSQSPVVRRGKAL